MQIPFTDGLFGRTGGRPPPVDPTEGVDAIEIIEDQIIDSLDAAEPPPAEPALLLQKMETSSSGATSKSQMY